MTTEAIPLTRRPKRRRLTPVTGVLAAVLVAALGFLGGVQAQKGHGTTSTAAVPSFGTGGPPGGAGFQPASAGSGTTGTVAYVKHGVIYVKTTDGSTVKVKVDGETKVTRTASTAATNVHPGDAVTVQGTTSGGTVKATTLTATAN